MLALPEKVIRCSGLPTWEDCERRGAATSFPGLIRDAGYDLRGRIAHVGALVGSGTHAGAAYTLKQKLQHGGLGHGDEAEDRALEELKRRLVEEGAVWDETSPNYGIAQRQVARMVRRYRETLAPQITPISVEEEFRVVLVGGFVLVGHTDALAQEMSRLRDLKTGTTQRANGSQYGAYALLLLSLGRPVRQIVEDYLPRVRIDAAQPDPIVTLLPFEEPQQRAFEVIEHIRSSVSEFERRLAVGDRPPEGAFRANPMSVLCSEKFCPAWGTAFCRAHKQTMES